MSEITGPPPAYKVPQTSGKGPDHAQHTDQKQKKNASDQQDNASSKDQSGTQSKHHTVEPAVTVSASMMGLKVGDHLEGRVEKVTPDNQLVFITKEATFLVEPSAGMKPGQSLELEVTSTSNPMTADIVRRETQLIEPPIPVEMSLVQVSKQATENAHRQLPQTSSQQLPHYPTISPIPKAVETGQDSLILRQQSQSFVQNTASQTMATPPSSPQGMAPNIAQGSRPQTVSPNTQPISTFQPNLTEKRQAPLSLLDIQDKSLLNKLPAQPMQPNLSQAAKSLMANLPTLDSIKPLMVFQATLLDGTIKKEQISFQHNTNDSPNKTLKNFQVALFSSNIQNLPNTVMPLAAKVDLPAIATGSTSSQSAILTLANAILSIPKEQAISLANMVTALTTEDSTPTFQAVIMPPATANSHNVNPPKPSTMAQLYDQLKSEQSNTPSASTAVQDAGSNQSTLTQQGPARGAKASQSNPQQATMASSNKNSNDLTSTQNSATHNTNTKAGTAATATEAAATETTTIAATDKTATTGITPTTTAATDKTSVTGTNPSAAATDKTSVTGTNPSAAATEKTVPTEKIEATTAKATDKTVSTGTEASTAAATEKNAAMGPMATTTTDKDKSAAAGFIATTTTASQKTAVTGAEPAVTTAPTPPSAKTAPSNQPQTTQGNHPSILAQTTLHDAKVPLPNLDQIVETKDDALKLAESMRPESAAPSTPITREIPHVALKDALQTWPVMAASAQALQSALSPALQGQTAGRLPNMGQALQNSALFFLAAVGLNDPKTWLGKKAVSDLEQKKQGTLLKALQKEFNRLFQLSGLGEKTAANGQLDWRPHLIPIFQNDHAQAMVVLTRPDEHHKADQENDNNKGGNDDSKNRFVVATRFKTFGMIELDGLLRPNRLDLHLRSSPVLTKPVQDLLTQTIEMALSKNALVGQINFGDLKDSALNIPEILDKAENAINKHHNFTIG